MEGQISRLKTIKKTKCSRVEFELLGQARSSGDLNDVYASPPPTPRRREGCDAGLLTTSRTGHAWSM